MARCMTKRTGRGLAMGTMVGALTLGSALPERVEDKGKVRPVRTSQILAGSVIR